jgi:glycosyltransferase involved in cell wall biosynthesis
VIPPYITTSWDIAHKITPYLPEFSGLGNQTKKRDNVAKKVFAKAYKIVVGTSVGKDELMNVYGINPERLLVNPLPQEAIPEKINRQRTTSTIIYPANFWPHKNHAILIKAIKLLVDQSDINVNLILTGSDRGAYGSLKSLVENLSLDDHVDFRGFVTTDELHNLYASSSLLVFPTLIGPDNLPPLEALARGCQITVSDIPGAREQFGKFSTYFDPYDVRSVAGAIQEALKKDSSSFSDEEIYSFLDDRNPKKYVDLVIKEIEKLSHLTEFN